jgi:hypothetical protein
MFDDAALALEEIAPEDKNRTAVLGARVVLYFAAKKWDMAAAVASHLVKVEPENEAWWINLAYSVMRIEGIEKATCGERYSDMGLFASRARPCKGDFWLWNYIMVVGRGSGAGQTTLARQGGAL